MWILGLILLLLCHSAMLQKWWKQQAGSPWWRLTHTWLPKLTALWLQPSALFLDPHASASNNPNNLKAGHLHSYTHTHTRTKTQHNISPLTHRTNLPLAVTCYTTYILPQVVHFGPIHSCCLCSSWTVRENDNVNGRGGSGRVGQVGLWSGCCLQGNHNQTLFSPQPLAL